CLFAFIRKKKKYWQQKASPTLDIIDPILYNPSVLIDKEPIFFIYRLQKNKPQGSMVSLEVLHFLIKMY
ncbi:hypothetical protein LDA65_12250, partial [Enterococcus faecium]|nr:hypothetical protein [Enterococcus faecium]